MWVDRVRDAWYDHLCCGGPTAVRRFSFSATTKETTMGSISAREVSKAMCCPTCRRPLREYEKTNRSWLLRFERGFKTDPATGIQRRVQACVTFEGSKAEARERLAELERKVRRGKYVETTAVTFLEFMRGWLETSVKPMRRPQTYRGYRVVVEEHIAKSDLAHRRLQSIRKSDLKRYLAELAPKLKRGSIDLQRAVLSVAFASAVEDGILEDSPAVRLPGGARTNEVKRVKCWSELEARKFLAHAKTLDEQSSALYQFLLDSGCRIREALGLCWSHVDFDAGRVLIEQQLCGVVDGAPVYGPTKTGDSRKVDLAAETLAALRLHRRVQAEHSMAHRTSSVDHGLVFAKRMENCHLPGSRVGAPAPNLAGPIKRLCEEAGVTPLSAHCLRHTCASLLLAAGEAVHVVSARQGHKNVSMTLNTYAHAIPSMQATAARRMSGILHGRRDATADEQA
jgi:integrase